MPCRYCGDMCCRPSTSLPDFRCSRTSSSVRGASSSIGVATTRSAFQRVTLDLRTTQYSLSARGSSVDERPLLEAVDERRPDPDAQPSRAAQRARRGAARRARRGARRRRRRDPEVRAVVLTGAGGAFCAGGDLGRFEELHDARVYRHVSHRLTELDGGGRAPREAGRRRDRRRGHRRRPHAGARVRLARRLAARAAAVPRGAPGPRPHPRRRDAAREAGRARAREGGAARRRRPRRRRRRSRLGLRDASSPTEDAVAAAHARARRDARAARRSRSRAAKRLLHARRRRRPAHSAMLAESLAQTALLADRTTTARASPPRASAASRSSTGS